MADRTVAVRFTADTSDLERAVARATDELQGFTSQEVAVARATAQADKALGEQAKALGLTTAQLKGARAAAERFASADRAAMKESEDAALKVRDAKLELVELLGGPSKDVVDKLSRATSALGAGSVAAAGGIALAAAAVVGLTLAAAAATIGAVALVHGAGDLARSMQEIEDKGGALDVLGVSDAQIASFDRAAASLDSVGVLGDQLALTLAAELTPAVEASARAVLKASLIASDLFATYAEGDGILRTLAKFAASSLIAALAGPVDTLSHLARGFATLAELAGMDAAADKANGFANAWVSARDAIAGAAVDAVFNGASVAADALGDATSDYDARVDALIGTVGRATEATRTGAKATATAKDADKERAEALKVLEADLKRVGDAQRASNKAAEDAGKATSALLKSSEAFGAVAPDAVAKLRAEYQALDAQILAQIEANARAGVSTAALETERAELAQRTRAVITAEEGKIRDAEAASLDARAQAQREFWQGVADQAASTADAILGAAGDAGELYADKLAGALEQTQTRLGSIMEAIAGLTDESVAGADLAGVALVNAYVAGKVAAEDLTEAQKSMIASELEARAKAVAEQEAIQRDAAMKAFNVSKAAATSQALIAGAVAVMQALAQLGPIAGTAAAVAIGATTAVQVATIAAQEPTFHTGGFVDSMVAGATMQRPGYAPDERPARLQSGEAVLSRQGRAALGDDVIRSANAGRAPSPTVNVTQVYDGQVIGRAVQDQLKTSSSLRRSLAKSRPGHSKR